MYVGKKYTVFHLPLQKETGDMFNVLSTCAILIGFMPLNPALQKVIRGIYKKARVNSGKP